MINEQKLYKGIQFEPDNLHLKIEGLETTAAQITTLKHLYDAMGRNSRKVGEVLGYNGFSIRRIVNSGKPTVILVNEINGFFKYTLLK